MWKGRKYETDDDRAAGSVPAHGLLLGVAGADEALLKPFVLGTRGPGSVAEKVAEVMAALASQGFTIVGEYTPYPQAAIIVATHDELKSNAAKSEHGGFGAAVRVSVTQVKDEVQVAYTNPVYMANAYRMQGDLAVWLPSSELRWATRKNSAQRV